MAITLTEDWSSYAENTEVQNITGWTTSGAFAVNRAGAQVNATSQIKSLTSDGTLAYFESGNNSHYSEIRIDSAAQAGVVSNGPAVRCVDWENFIGLRPFGTSNIQIFHRTGSSSYQQLALPSHSHQVGDIYRLEVDGDTLRAFVNDTQLGSDIDITGIQSGSLAGFWTAGSRDPAFGPIEIGTLVAETITITGITDRQVIEAASGAADFTLTGTYSGGTAPTSLSYRIIAASDSSVVRDWTTLDASPSGGTFSQSINVPRGNYYRFEVRYDNLTNIVAQSPRIGFGFLIYAGGQSNVDALFQGGGDATPNANVSIFDGTATWSAPVAQQITHVLNAIATQFNCVAAAFTTAVSNTSITQHLSGGSNYQNRVDTLTNAGGKVSLFFWGQGEGDTGSAGGYNNYLTRLGDLRTDMITRTGQNDLRMFIVQLGRNDGQAGNDIGWQTVRAAQTTFANDTANTYISHQTMDLPMTDGLHRTAAGYKQEVLRAADTINSVFAASGNSGLGPIPIAASVNGSDVTIVHSLNGSSSITLPANALDLYEVSEDDFTTTLTINSIATSGNEITLSLASTPAGEVKIRSHQGQDPDETKVPTGTVTYAGQAVMVSPVVTELQSATISSTLNITITGIPDGSFMTVLDDDEGNRLFRGNLVYSTETTSQTLSVVAGTRVKGYVDDGLDPSSNAAYIEGVTS